MAGSRGARGRSAAFVLVVFAAVCSASEARAQGEGASSPEEARRTALYKDGFDAASAGRWAEARDRFAAALAIRSSPKVLFSLAQAEEQLGQLTAAGRDYGLALDGAKAAGEADVASASQSARAALEPRVPTVRIVAQGAPAATAKLDDQPVAVGTPVPVDPGTHRLIVSAPGMRDAQATVAISERQRLDVPVRLDAAGSDATSGAASPSASDAAPPTGDAASGPEAAHGTFPWRTVGLVAAGAGIVTLGVGTYFGIEAKSKNDQSNSSGCNGDKCTGTAAQIRRDAISAGNTSTVLFVAGGLLTAGGIVLWLVAPSSEGGSGVSVTPVALGAGGGITLAGRWQ
jgi:hypothetical protein